MLTREQVRSWYGWAELSPQDPIVAGSVGRWQLTYHVGRYGVAAGGSLKLLFRTASDWPILQGKDPYEESFLTVTTTGQGRLAWRYDARGYIQPWPKAVTVDVAQRALAEGDTVLFYLGDPEGGSPGVRAQTFAERSHELRVVVDPIGTGRYVAVPSPIVAIVGGPAVRLALVLPSQAAPGEPFELLVRLEDRWGNLARGYAGRIDLEGLPGVPSVELAAGDGGVVRVRSQGLPRPGIWRVRAREARLGLSAESNPLQVREARAGALLPLWGDLHGQSAETCGTNSAAEYFRYARDVAALDFCAQQGNAYQITPAFWQDLQETVRRCHEPGRFVTFLGYHWAGGTGAGGNRNVLFLGDSAELHRCSPVQGAGGTAETGCFPLPELYDRLRGQQALLIAGTGSPLASLAFHDPSLEPLVEVCSAWGEAPWLLEEAMQRGCQVGLVANSADLQGRPGASYPGAGEMVSRGGLTCAYAGERSREAIWEALRARRCYGTTGERILLQVEADGHPMGAAYRAKGAPRFRVRAAGTAEIERAEIRRGVELACRYPAQGTPRPGWLRVLWGGALARDWPRHVPWDGTLRLQGGRIRSVQPYGFHSAARGIVLANEQAVSWRSQTAGNENGLLLEIEAGPGARLEFYAPLASLTADLDSLPYEQSLGGEGLHVRLEPLPQGTGRRDLDLAWADDALRPAVTPYYVTVYQVDGAKAWSSPIYVDGSGPLGSQ